MVKRWKGGSSSEGGQEGGTSTDYYQGAPGFPRNSQVAGEDLRKKTRSSGRRTEDGPGGNFLYEGETSGLLSFSGRGDNSENLVLISEGKGDVVIVIDRRSRRQGEGRTNDEVIFKMDKNPKMRGVFFKRRLTSCRESQI